MTRPPARSRLGAGVLAAGAAAVLPLARLGLADIDPNSGIDFVTIGAPGNRPWSGTTPPTTGDMALGRGRVDYMYRIGRFELTTAQAVEFFNAAFDRPAADRIPWLVAPTFWGGVPAAPTTPGGQRWSAPAGNEMRPVGNISWRMAAIYCNWLCNNKSADRSAFMNGAYDVSQFSGLDIFTDQVTHNPGARYWIPTWDEWLKAAHYDPQKANPDGTRGGWWVYSNRSDTPPVGGPPGVGQANFGWFSGNTQFTVPLGAYPQTTSPWGLLDVAGATQEWTEGILNGSQMTRYRVVEGSYWGGAPGDVVLDAAYAATTGAFPSLDTFEFGVRIASAVPPPPEAAFVLTGSLFILARRRRRHNEAAGSSRGGAGRPAGAGRAGAEHPGHGPGLRRA